jgi:hypothetical protein
MRKISVLFATIFVTGMTLAAQAQSGPQTGDDCSRWIVCQDGGAASGSYPACECTGVPTQPLTCEQTTACKFPNTLSGTYPDCYCEAPPPPPPPECGRCEVLIGGQCVPIMCKPPG